MAIHDKLKLTLQSFHQCSSLVSIKLTSTNFLLWKSQVLPLIRSLGILEKVRILNSWFGLTMMVYLCPGYLAT
ncbi:hypothetical protein AAG906_018477 [Vitis piasezkii]